MPSVGGVQGYDRVGGISLVHLLGGFASVPLEDLSFVAPNTGTVAHAVAHQCPQGTSGGRGEGHAGSGDKDQQGLVGEGELVVIVGAVGP